MNHSRLHPVLKHNVVISASGNVDVLFHAKEDIDIGTQLTFDYGPSYWKLQPCVSDCKKCSDTYDNSFLDKILFPNADSNDDTDVFS